MVIRIALGKRCYRGTKRAFSVRLATPRRSRFDAVVRAPLAAVSSLTRSLLVLGRAKASWRLAISLEPLDFHPFQSAVTMTISKPEAACVYAALVLIDDEIDVTGEKIQTILKAANVEVEPYWPGLFAKALETVNVRDLITNVASAVGAAPAAGAAVAAPVAEAKEEKKEAKKEEESEEEDDDMGFGLFE